jgi:hypothetical protein
VPIKEPLLIVIFLVSTTCRRPGSWHGPLIAGRSILDRPGE